MCSENSRYIVAIARKGPRLFDLFHINASKPIVVSDRAIPYLPLIRSEIVPLFDDIIIFGSTMNDKIQELRERGSNPVPYSLVYNITEAKIKANYGKALCEKDINSFCDDIVSAFQLLGKPFDIDHPIFTLTSISSTDFKKTIERINKEKKYIKLYANLTSNIQHENGILSLVYVYTPPFRLESLFNPQSCIVKPSSLYKVRIFYNSHEEKVTIVPMYISYLSFKDKSNNFIFNETLSHFNKIVSTAKRFISDASIMNEKAEEILYRLIFYLTEYLYGMCFISSFDIFPDMLILDIRDTYYLYGDKFGEYLFKILLANKDEIDNFLAQTSYSSNDSMETKNIENIQLFRELFCDEKYQSMKSIRECLTWSNESDSLWNICRLMKVKDIETRMPNAFSKTGRLKFGFIFEDLFLILKNKIDIQDSKILSVLIDYFIDRGILIPLFLKYPTNYLVRAYRFGENLNGLAEKKRAYFIRMTLERLFKNIKSDRISQFDFEKFIAFLIQLVEKFGFKYKELEFKKMFDEFGARPVTLGFRGVVLRDGQPFLEKRFVFRESLDNKVIKLVNGYISLDEKFHTLFEPESNPFSTIAPDLFLYVDLWTKLVYEKKIWPRKYDIILLLTTCDNKDNFLSSYMAGLDSWFYHDYLRFSKILTEIESAIIDLKDNKLRLEKYIEEVDKSIIKDVATRLVQCENKKEVWEKRYEIVKKIDEALKDEPFVGPVWEKVKNALIDLSPLTEKEQTVLNYLQTFYEICRESTNVLRSALKERNIGELKKYIERYNKVIENTGLLPTLSKIPDSELFSIIKVLKNNYSLLEQFFKNLISKWEEPIKPPPIHLLNEVKREHIELAIELARSSTSENDNPRPKVGAVIVKNGEVVVKAFRNEDGKGSHAEVIAITKAIKEGIDLEGSILVTTMEPCTKGKCHEGDVRIPCALMVDHVVNYYKMKGVVYLMEDPNPEIRGTVFLRYVSKVPIIQYPAEDLIEKVKELNRDFIEHIFRTKGIPKPAF